MKRQIEIILLVLVIAVLSAYLILQRTDRTGEGLPEFPKIEEEEFTRLTIRKGGSELTLKKDGERWRILPEGYPADGKAVDRMLETLGSLRLTAVASTSENDSVYDLDEEASLQVTAYKGEDPLIRIGVGKAAPTYRHTFVKLTDDPRVYHAEKNFRNHFDKEVSALRDKEVLRIDEEVSEIILTEGGQKSLHILRATAPVEADPSGEEAGRAGREQEDRRWETLEGRPLKDKEIDNLVKTLSNLQCDGFLEESGGGLGVPAFSVSLKGSRNYELFLYEEREGKTVATSSGSEHPFLLSEWKSRKVRKSPGDLLQKED